jgi:hypothetical protein
MRSRGLPKGRECARVEGRRARQRKIDNFLPRRLGVCYCFSERPGKFWLALFMGDAQPGFGVKKRRTTREWRRKPLKSLKTDSAIRRLAVVGKEDRSGELVFCV